MQISTFSLINSQCYNNRFLIIYVEILASEESRAQDENPPFDLIVQITWSVLWPLTRPLTNNEIPIDGGQKTEWIAHCKQSFLR